MTHYPVPILSGVFFFRLRVCFDLQPRLAGMRIYVYLISSSERSRRSSEAVDISSVNLKAHSIQTSNQKMAKHPQNSLSRPALPFGLPFSNLNLGHENSRNCDASVKFSWRTTETATTTTATIAETANRVLLQKRTFLIVLIVCVCVCNNTASARLMFPSSSAPLRLQAPPK